MQLNVLDDLAEAMKALDGKKKHDKDQRADRRKLVWMSGLLHIRIGSLRRRAGLARVPNGASLLGQLC